MPTPPILEVYVLWHPDDDDGAEVARDLVEHFHGPAYAGLAGGAVEVYHRSVAWAGPGLSPRPLPFMQPLPAGLAPAQVTVVVPVLGRGMAAAVREPGEWRNYLEAVLAADPPTTDEAARVEREGSGNDAPWVAVYPVTARSDLSGTALDAMVSDRQTISGRSLARPGLLARELAQAIVQRLHRESGAPGDSRVTVFVSHTKAATREEGDSGSQLVSTVRQVLQDTRLDAFFDAHDIQTGEDWVTRLDAASGRNALLMVRTNLYASRRWTQQEVLRAKQGDVALVALHAVCPREDRGSFLMDHVPVIVCERGGSKLAIEAALNRLVDETLKKALWRAQSVYLSEGGFDWLPAHAPEPTTLANWLSGGSARRNDEHLVILHPDPPIAPPEYEVLEQICRLAGIALLDVLTPRSYASRGGMVGTHE